MSDYKLVPVEPTPEMLKVACDEEQRPLPMWTRMKAIYTAMLAAAPAAQGEPVGWQYYHDGKWWRWASYPRVYATSQPAEQQPAPDVAGLQAELERERKRRFDGNEQASREHREDMKSLVEALTELCDEIDKHDIHTAISKTSISWFKRKAREALAAHYKQGGEV